MISLKYVEPQIFHSEPPRRPPELLGGLWQPLWLRRDIYGWPCIRSVIKTGSFYQTPRYRLLACSAMRLTQSSTGFRSLRNRRRIFSDFSLAVLKVRLIGGISPSRVPAPHIKKSKNGELPLIPLLKVEDRRGGRNSRSKSSKEMTDLRTVIFNKKASAKRSWRLRPRTSEGRAL